MSLKQLKYILWFVLIIGIFVIPNIISNTPADRVEAQKLLENAKRFKGISQTYSQISNKILQEKFIEQPDLDLRKTIIEQALAKEVEMAGKGYAVFYTAIPYMRMFQDITRKQYKAIHGKVGALQEKAFQFVRYSYQDPIYTQYASATDFLVKELTAEGIIDDNVSRLKTILVSTNLSFFGNLGWKEESTYYYFNHPQPWVKANPEWLMASLQSFGYSTAFVNELLALATEIVTKTGDIFQIFIPTGTVNMASYISWRQGIPLDTYFIQKVFKRDYLTYNPAIDINFMAFHRAVFAVIAEYKKKYKALDPSTLEMTNYLITNAKAGKYYLEPFLSSYKQGTVPDMDLYQARLVIGKWLLDPTMGVKIYRYSILDQTKEKQYKEKLKKIFEAMEQERQKRLGLSQSAGA